MRKNMRKTLFICLIFIIFSFQIVSSQVIFSDEFDNDNYISEGWLFSEGTPIEINGNLSTDNASGGGGVYQNFSSSINLYEDVWEVNIRISANETASYSAFILTPIQGSTGTQLSIRYDISAGIWSIDTICYGSCSCSSTTNSYSSSIFNPQNFTIKHEGNKTFTLLANNNIIRNINLTGCDYNSYNTELYLRNSPVNIDFFSIGLVFSLPLVTIISPENHTTSNQKLNVTYNMTKNGSCSLYINDMMNMTNSSVIENTFSFFYVNDMEDDGDYNFYLNCTAENTTIFSDYRHYHFHAEAPLIFLLSPSHLNNSVFNNTINIIGNVTDENLFRVNETIKNFVGDIYYSNYSGDLINGTEFYSLSKNIDSLLFPSGLYFYIVEAADTHTKEIFPEELILLDEEKNQIGENEKELLFSEKSISGTILSENGEKLELILKNDNIAISLSEDLKMAVEKEKDRFIFVFSSDNIGEKEVMFSPKEKLVPILESKYPCHYVFGNYWFDCAGMDVISESFSEDENSILVKFLVGEEEVISESLGGLNENIYSVSFNIMHEAVISPFADKYSSYYTLFAIVLIISVILMIINEYIKK